MKTFRDVWQRLSPRTKVVLVALVVLLGLAYPAYVFLFAETTPPARPRKEAPPSPTTPATLRPLVPPEPSTSSDAPR